MKQQEKKTQNKMNKAKNRFFVGWGVESTESLNSKQIQIAIIRNKGGVTSTELT